MKRKKSSGMRHLRRVGSGNPAANRELKQPYAKGHFSIVVLPGGRSPWSHREPNSVGVFATREEAHRWAEKNLRGDRYRLAWNSGVLGRRRFTSPPDNYYLHKDPGSAGRTRYVKSRSPEKRTGSYRVVYNYSGRPSDTVMFLKGPGAGSHSSLVAANAAAAHASRHAGGYYFVTNERGSVVATFSKGHRVKSRSGERAGEGDAQLRGALGTLAHNRAFSSRDLAEYTGGKYGSATINRLVRAGKLKRVAGGYYPTPTGWTWIEKRS